MTNAYRAYRLAQQGEVANLPFLLEVKTDDAAVEAAQKYVDGRDVEVRQGRRLIATLRHHLASGNALAEGLESTPEACRANARALMKAADGKTEPADVARLLYEAMDWLRRASKIKAGRPVA